MSVGGQRSTRLLALLLVNANAVVPLHQIVETLWDAPPKSARQQVHNVIGHLRRRLGSLVTNVELITAQQGYRLQVDPEYIDANEFERCLQASQHAESTGDLDAAARCLRAALGLWRGPALAGLDVRSLVTAGARLNERRIYATERFAAVNLQRGESDLLISELMGLVAEFPLRETLRGSLMESLYRSGRPAEALAVYDEGRRLLAGELGLDPSAHLQTLHARILRQEPPFESRPAPGAGVPPTADATELPDVGRQLLPYDTIDFTGRTAEITHLMSVVRSAPVTAPLMVTVTGMAGVGKTAFAVHVAHLLGDRYPDGQFFIDLQAFDLDGDPLDSTEACDVLLRRAGLSVDRLANESEERLGLWRAWLASKRVLLLLDNVASAAQIRPLLPGAGGSLVLVTSRRRLTALDGAVALPLDVFAEPDARQFFAAVAGTDRVRRQPETVRKAVGLCGRLPLAIRIAAARLRARPSWTGLDLVEQLRTPQRRDRFLATEDRSVMAVLAASHRRLEPARSWFLRVLSLHPGADFGASAAAALAGSTLEEAERHLEGLLDDNLLIECAARRYRFHVLIRDWSRGLVERLDPPAERHAAVHRIIDYYLGLADALGERLAVGRSDSDATRILDLERDNLLAAARLAGKDPSHPHAWQLLCSVQSLLERRIAGYARVGKAVAAVPATAGDTGATASDSLRTR